MAAEICSYNKYCYVTTDDKVCKHYFNNLIILLLRIHASQAETERCR